MMTKRPIVWATDGLALGDPNCTKAKGRQLSFLVKLHLEDIIFG
jgi:hypothetical protein